MDKEFVPYEEALALKELGFDEECFGRYNINKTLLTYIEETNSDLIRLSSKEQAKGYCTAPLYQKAFRWFRDKHKLNSEVNYLPNIEKYGIITSDMFVKPKDLSNNENFKRGIKVTNNYVKYDTYEEAQLACLKKLIEIVKEKELN